MVFSVMLSVLRSLRVGSEDMVAVAVLSGVVNCDISFSEQDEVAFEIGLEISINGRRKLL